MKFRWFRNFVKGCSLTAALFVFQACYGTPTGIYEPITEKNFSFEVFNADGTQALSNAKIYAKCSNNDHTQTDSTTTGANGRATISFAFPEGLNPIFEFTVKAEGFVQKDTAISYTAETGDTLKIYLQKK